MEGGWLASTRRWWVSAAAVVGVLTFAPAASAEVPTLDPVGVPTILPGEVPKTGDGGTVGPSLEPLASLPGLPGEGAPEGGSEPSGSSDGGVGDSSAGGADAAETGDVTRVLGGHTAGGGIAPVRRRPVGLPPPVIQDSYSDVAGRALGDAAGRALRLASPLAPPIAFAIVVLALIAVAARTTDASARAEGAARRVYRL